MPVVLTSESEFETWLTADTAEALKLQRPASDDAVTLLADKPEGLSPK
jgi:putative SOS response-associated peptidase YedK